MPGRIVKLGISPFLCVTLLVVALVVAAPAPASTDRETKRLPSVAVTSEAPIVVVGRGFRSRERISLRLTVGNETFSRVLRATAAGRFRAAFAQVDASCYPFSVVAVGRAGSRATQTRRFTIPPPCGIAPQP